MGDIDEVCDDIRTLRGQDAVMLIAGSVLLVGSLLVVGLTRRADRASLSA